MSGNKLTLAGVNDALNKLAADIGSRLTTMEDRVPAVCQAYAALKKAEASADDIAAVKKLGEQLAADAVTVRKNTVKPEDLRELWQAIDDLKARFEAEAEEEKQPPEPWTRRFRRALARWFDPGD